MSEELQENKMGTMPVRRLVLSMSLPMMIAMLVQALYNVVDSYFVAKLSENALTAVGMVFPFQNLMIAVGVGTGVGVNAFLSRSLGEKNYDAANRAAENGVFLAVLSTLVFTVAGLTLAHPFIAVQTDIPDIVSSGTAYMRICGGLSFGLFLEIMFERLLQATGRTFYTMLTQGTGAIINIIMDPVLIFGLGPFPRMEVAGAAAATVLGQIVAAVLAVLFNLTCNHDIHPTLRGFRPNGPVIRNIYSVGAPSIILNSIGSVMTFGMNQILFAFSSTAVAVFNVYFKLQSFVFMPVFGLNNGMVPIVSYNYGARKRKRLVDTVKFSALLAVAIMLVGLVVIQLFPANILGLFEASPDMLAIGVPALRIISLCFVFAGFSIICSSTFQALGNGLLSMMISHCPSAPDPPARGVLPVPQRQRHRRLVGLSYRGAGLSGPLCDLPAAYLPQGDPPPGVSAPPSPAYRGRPYLSGIPFPAGYSAALGRRGGPMWASAPTEVCCGRHRLAKMLRRGGACPRPRAAIKAAPTSGVLSPAGYLAVLGRRGGCPHPPGAGRWPGGAGRRGRRPLQRSAAAGTARPKCSVGAGLVPACGRP